MDSEQPHEPTQYAVSSISVSHEDNPEEAEQPQPVLQSVNETESEYDFKLDEVLVNQQRKDIDLAININNSANKIDEPYEYCSQKICKIMPRLSFVLIITTCVLIIGNLDKFKSKSTDVLISVFAVILTIIIILCASGTLVRKWNTAKAKFAQNRDYKPAKPKRNLTNFQKQRQLFYDDINQIFGIVREKGSCSVDRTKYGVILLGFIIYSALNIMLIEAIFSLTSNINCESQEMLNDAWIRGKCVVNQSSFSMAYVFVWGIVVTVLSYYHITEQCYEELETERRSIQNKTKHTKVEKCFLEIDEVIQEWSEKQSRQERKLEIIVLGVVCFVYQFGVYGVVRNDIVGGGINGGALIFSLYLYIGDAVMFTIIMFTVHEHLFYFYSFPKLIMQQLSHQLKVESTKDIILWWELRKYYFCVIQIYAAGMGGIIFGALCGAMIFVVFWILTVRSWDSVVTFVFLFWAIYLLFVAFIIVSHAVNYHLKQFSHFHTVNKERLRLSTIKYYKSTDSDALQKRQMGEDDEVTNRVFDIILRDIKENDQPILVFGIAMNSDFMLFLRASVITIAIAAYFGA